MRVVIPTSLTCPNQQPNDIRSGHGKTKNVPIECEWKRPGVVDSHLCEVQNLGTALLVFNRLLHKIKEKCHIWIVAGFFFLLTDRKNEHYRYVHIVPRKFI